DQRVACFCNAVPFGAFQKSRRHPVLMHGINFIKVYNHRAWYIEKPWPFTVWALQLNERARGQIGHLEGTSIISKFPIGVARKCEIGLGRKRSKPPTQSISSIKEETRAAVILLDQKRKKRMRDRRPFFWVTVRLRHYTYQQHPQILGTKDAPPLSIGKECL